jgi:hypothetical protein
MRFQASNGRTYKIDFNQFPPSVLEGDRFWLGIVEGDPINAFDEDSDEYEDNGATIAIAPFFNSQTGLIDWDNSMYSREFLDVFVPPDLKEFCERVVRNLMLL